MAGIAGGLGLLVLGFAIGTAVPDEAAFRERADKFAKRHGFELSEGMTIGALLDGELARLSIGLIEIRFPPSLFTTGGSNGDLSSIALDLVDLQGEWIAWTSREGALPPGWKKLQKALAGWISGWKTQVGTDPGSLRGRDLLEVSPEETRSASRALASLAAEALGAAGELPRASFVFMATREDFVEFAALVGLLEARHRPYFWIEDLVLWTEFDFDGTRVLPLEYASPDSTADYRRAIGMNSRNPKGMREQVEQVVLRSMLVTIFDGRLDPSLAASMANNLIIMQHGEVDTRSDGDLRSRSTSEISVFVPGGASTGGVLPVNSADTRWRALKGKDRFVGVLAQAQDDGAQKAKERSERTLGFLLRGDVEGSTTVVRAPFLGPGAAGPPEAMFAGDYLEFLRAYRVAFVHWLREEAAPSTKESHRRFAEFLSALHAGETDLLKSFERIYDRPLSTSDAQTLDTSLEGAFLLWLSRR